MTDYARLRRRLLKWYRQHARDLPWRRTSDPYAIWVSEIMLQQTQVVTVIEYYQRFLKRFPTVHALADADEHEVLRCWEGLGYYRRARQMHRAANEIVRQFAGEFPREFNQILSLPGIGRYTAGAIASIALGQSRPILEGNTLRLFSRLMALREDPHSAHGQQRLWEFAEAILPRTNAGEVNQALMELGSEICRPRNPACDRCPLARHCPTSAHGWQDQIPVQKTRVRYEDLTEVAVVVRKSGSVLIRRCGEHERWAGLWDFPRFAVASPREIEQIAVARTRELTGVDVSLDEPLAQIKHTVTRFRIQLHCHLATFQSGRLRPMCAGRWISTCELDGYALSVTGRKISRLLAG